MSKLTSTVGAARLVSSSIVLLCLQACGEERLSVGADPTSVERDAQADASGYPTTQTDGGTLPVRIGVDGQPASARMVCRGACVELSAQVVGARSQLLYQWSEASFGNVASGSLCLSESKTVELSVSESSAATELGQALQGSAAVSLDVYDCADAGTDANIPETSQALCLRNMSFEDIAAGGMNFWTHDWKACDIATYTLENSRGQAGTDLLPTSHGESYVGFHATLTNEPFVYAKPSISQKLCSPMRAEQTVALRMQAKSYEIPALIPLGNDRARVQIFGTMNECDQGELLWQSEYIGATDAWVPLCATLTPKQAYPYFRIGIEGDDANGRLVTLDDLRPLAAGESCL